MFVAHTPDHQPIPQPHVPPPPPTSCLLPAACLYSLFYCFSVEAKKVILRQGHYAENFYFVIVGAGKFDQYEP